MAGIASIWLTRVELPQDLPGNTAEGVAGGRRDNPRGKRVWPLCPTAAHERSLRRTLRAAASGARGCSDGRCNDEGTGGGIRGDTGGDTCAGRVVQHEDSFSLALHERFAIATFPSDATARVACYNLESMEAQWTAQGRASAGGGEGVAVLDREGRCFVDYRPQFMARPQADALLQLLHLETPWVGVRAAAQAGKKRQPRQVRLYLLCCCRRRCIVCGGVGSDQAYLNTHNHSIAR
jgi:hypothetical protein